MRIRTAAAGIHQAFTNKLPTFGRMDMGVPKQEASGGRREMEQPTGDGKKRQYVVMSKENIEVLLEILDAIGRLDDDDLLVIENLVKTLPPDLREDLVSP